MPQLRLSAAEYQRHRDAILERLASKNLAGLISFTVEPGVLASGFVGLRHLDTVAVTESGIEFITYDPRDLASMTIPI